MAPAICPCCGYDLVLDEPIVLGDLSIDPRGIVAWHGERILLTVSERIVITAIVKAAPRPISYAVIRERLGCDGDSDVERVHLCRAKKKLAASGHKAPIEAVYGEGVRWAA